MVTETKQLIPLMLIDDKSRYITHESNEAELKAAASELGECLKKAMLDCYANNTLIKEAYISNIQKYISVAKHEITFEPNMEVALVDQYGRPWIEEGINKSLISPLTGDITASETAFNNSFTWRWDNPDEYRKPIPMDIVANYYKQKKQGVQNPDIDILSLGMGPLSYEAAKEYIESDSMYMHLVNEWYYPIPFYKIEELESLESKESTSDITENQEKVTKIDERGYNLIANMERNKSFINYDENTGLIKNIPSIGSDIGYGHDITQDDDEYSPDSMSASEAYELLKVDVEEIEKSIISDMGANFTQDQFNALVSIRYNIGYLSNVKVLRRYLKKNLKKRTYSREEMRNILRAYYDRKIEKAPWKEKYKEGWYNRIERFLDVFFDSNYGDMPIDAVNGKVEL